MSTLVMKFSGSCVDTTSGLAQLLSIVLHEREHWDNLLLVVSALEGVTDSLIEAAHLAQLDNRRGYRRIIATLRTRHLALVEALPLGQVERSGLLADIDHLLFDSLDIYQTLSEAPSDTIAPQTTDAIIGVGERLSTRIVAALLRQNDLRGVAVDAANLIVTDDVYGNASPNLELTCERISENLLPMMERKIIPVVTGFVGATVNGRPTTLGRGGSSYTASILAFCAHAKEVWIWTDVDGIMSSDPHEVPEAETISELSYDEVAELAYFGMQIVHTRMIKPLYEREIPLRIKNVFKPQQPGTLIHDTINPTSQKIKAVTSIPAIGLTAEHSGPLASISHLVENTIIASAGAPANVTVTSQSSARSFLCFVIPSNARPDAYKNAQKAIEDVLRRKPDTSSWRLRSVSMITAIGAQMNTLPTLAAEILQALSDVQLLAVALGPSGLSLSVIVATEDSETALQQIHQIAISSD
jgi:aspartokinase/homoserine dehydrogenase 1